jgi:hypothetical protein
MSRYLFQYPTERRETHHPFFPDRRRVQNIRETPEAQRRRTHNSLRFDLALFDIIMTARIVPEAVSYVLALSENLPEAFVEQSNIFAAIRERLRPSLAFLGGLVYRRRYAPGLQLRLLTRSEESLSRGGFKSIVPWTSMWSLGTGDEDCCRHEDFKNGIAVISWRSQNPNVTFTQDQARELAPVAEIAQDTLADEFYQMVNRPPAKLWSIPGIVRVGPSLTLRFDHAYLAQLLKRNVRASIGLVNPETIS